MLPTPPTAFVHRQQHADDRCARRRSLPTRRPGRRWSASTTSRSPSSCGRPSPSSPRIPPALGAIGSADPLRPDSTATARRHGPSWCRPAWSCAVPGRSRRRRDRPARRLGCWGRGSHAARRPRRLPRRARRVHRAGDQAARAAGRQHPLLRPPPGGRPHGLGSGRPAERAVGGLAARGPAAGRRGRPLPVPVPQGVRRPGRYEPGDGGDPRALRHEGPGVAQRPAERALHRREQRRPAADARVRHRGAAGGVGRRPGRGAPGVRLRDHRAAARLRRHAHGDDGRPRRRRLDHQRREDLELGDPPGAVRPDLRPHERSAGRRARDHGVPHARPLRPVSGWRSSCGRSTCRPTTPTSP